jgi:hypothetical protein
MLQFGLALVDGVLPESPVGAAIVPSRRKVQEDCHLVAWLRRNLGLLAHPRDLSRAGYISVLGTASFSIASFVVFRSSLLAATGLGYLNLGYLLLWITSDLLPSVQRRPLSPM